MPMNDQPLAALVLALSEPDELGLLCRDCACHRLGFAEGRASRDSEVQVLQTALQDHQRILQFERRVE